MYIGSSSTTVKFHSFPDGELVYNYQPGSKVQGLVGDISWSKDGSWLSLVPKAGPAEIISVRSHLKLIHTILDVEEPSCTAFQNTTKKFIAYGTKNGQILIYDIKSKKIKNRYPRASSLISHVEFTAKDTHLVAGCLNGDVLLYSNLTLGLSATYKIPRSESVSALRTNPSKRNFIIGGSNEGVVVVWDTNVNKQKFFVESHKASVTGVAFSPINSDLIISTGTDRQFCCYDIVSNKCIATVPVKNSMTAIDFSHDGTHFVMASQDGNICLYDSRRILEPILVFEGHKTTIKNIAFQKQEASNSISTLSEEKVISPRSIQDVEGGTTNDSFAFYQMSHEIADVPDCEVPPISINQADSFMAALGLGNESATEPMRTRDDDAMLSVTGGEGDHQRDISKSHQHASPWSFRPSKEKQLVQEKKSMISRQISTSTPNNPMCPESKIEAVVSPIVNIEAEVERQEISKLVPTEEIKKMIEEITRNEMSNLHNSLSYEIKYQLSNSGGQIRRMYLDIQMSMIKEFIKMENTINALREDMASSSPMSENYLLEENLRLKKQVALLEAQLTSKPEYTNGN